MRRESLWRKFIRHGSRPSLLAWLALLGVCAFFVIYRIVNLDEGWYLWAARLVYRGELLYRDFTYTQTPLLPYVYGPGLRVLGEGLYQGRVITAGFALVMALAAVAITRLRIPASGDSGATSGMQGGIFLLLLLASSLYIIAYYTYSATYALSGALLLGLLWTAGAPPRPRLAGTGWAAATGALLALGIAARLSLVAVLPPVLFYLLWRYPGRRRAIGGYFGVAFVAILAATCGPFLFIAPENMVYDIFGFHVDRVLRWDWHLQKIGRTLVQTMWDLGLLVAVNGGLWLYWLARRLRRADWWAAVARRDYELLLVACFFALLIVQLIPSTTISHYHTLQAPLLCILATIGIYTVGIHAAEIHPQRGHAMGMVLRTGRGWTQGAIAGLVLLNLVHQAGVVRAYDLVTWPPENQVQITQEVARNLRAFDLAGRRLLGFSTHLALEADMTIPRGYEMSIFSYRPAWTRAEALRNKAINNELLMEHLRQGVDAVALTEFELGMLYGEREAVLTTLHEHYRLWKSYPGFDPFRNRLYLYLPPQFGHNPHIVNIERAPVARFESQIALLGIEIVDAPTGEHFAPNSSLDIALYWQAPPEPLDQSYTMFVHLTDAQRNVINGWDNMPCRNSCPTHTWRADEVIRDEYSLILPALPDHVAPGEAVDYYVLTGMYHGETGAVSHPYGHHRGGVGYHDHRVDVARISVAR